MKEDVLEQLRAKQRLGKTYEVYCNFPFTYRDRIVKRGLSWANANELAAALQARFRKRHPLKSSWVSRQYGPRMEKK
jgi:hypothetical protein